MRRKGVPCGCTDKGFCCALKEKLAVLWDRTIGSILRINGISPDGDGDFTIEAGDNINLTETGTGNGLRISTTGGVSYYESGDAYVNVDNNDLKITVNAGITGGLALQDDLDTVAGAVSDILDGTTTVPNATDATNATYLGSNTANVGSDTKPIKIVNGQAVAVTDDLALNSVVSGILATGRITEIWDQGTGHIAIKFSNGLGIETGYTSGTVPPAGALVQNIALHNNYGWFTAFVTIGSSNSYYANIVPTIYRTSANIAQLNVWNNDPNNNSTQAFAWMIIGYVI